MKENNEQNFDTETSEFKKCYSLNSDSFNEIKEDKNLDLIQKNSGESELSKKDSLSSLNISNIDIPPINVPHLDKKNSNNIKDEIGKSKTDFIIRRSIPPLNENKRYDNINEIYNDNFKFFSFVKDEYNEEDDDIVNNDLTSRYDYEDNDQKEQIKKIDSYELKMQYVNIYSNNSSKIKESNQIKNKIENLNTDDKTDEKENKVNCKKNINDNELQINNNIFDSNDFMIKNKIKENEEKIEIQNKDDLEEINKQRGIKFLNMTKQKKIFQKFLSVSVDTSYLYSLEDDMKILILNPKINYNYPFNKKERELE